ncbi:hypothetical protein R1flu_020350 [Riccia fluitans]|uniref:Uncharacterized protein n=1 Tax=Riccia fluitans TaxID=41844 RepID=A0ABD1ZMF2_9MARC
MAAEKGEDSAGVRVTSGTHEVAKQEADVGTQGRKPDIRRGSMRKVGNPDIPRISRQKPWRWQWKIKARREFRAGIEALDPSATSASGGENLPDVEQQGVDLASTTQGDRETGSNA